VIFIPYAQPRGVGGRSSATSRGTEQSAREKWNRTEKVVGGRGDDFGEAFLKKAILETVKTKCVSGWRTDECLRRGWL